MKTTPNYEDLPAVFDSTLVRNHDMVHLRTCSRVASVKVNPWLWAEGKSRQEIADAQQNGLRFCRSCDPLLYLLRESTA